MAGGGREVIDRPSRRSRLDPVCCAGAGAGAPNNVLEGAAFPVGGGEVCRPENKSRPDCGARAGAAAGAAGAGTEDVKSANKSGPELVGAGWVRLAGPAANRSKSS